MTSVAPQSAQLLVSNQYAAHVGARLLDFFADTAPWPRRLWDVGSVLALEEAAEAGSWMSLKVLSTGAVEWYLRNLERTLGPDRGLGESRLRRELTQLLRSGLRPNSAARRRLWELLPIIAHGYLNRWTAAVDSPDPPSPERLARAVATHLLDLGHSSGQLHRWARVLVIDPAATLGDLLQSAANLADRDDSEYQVLVPFESVPDHQALASHLPEWLSADKVKAWLEGQGATERPRQNGGFVYKEGY